MTEAREEELLELGEVDHSENQTLSSIKKVDLSDRGGLFDSDDGDDSLDLLSHNQRYPKRLTLGGEHGLFGLSGGGLVSGVIVLSLIFGFGFVILFSYRLLEKPLDRLPPEAVSLSLVWSPAICQNVDKLETKLKTACGDVLKNGNNSFSLLVIGGFKPSVENWVDCTDSSQAPYVMGESLTESTQKELSSKYASYWPSLGSSVSDDWVTSYSKYGKCLFVNSTEVANAEEYLKLAKQLHDTPWASSLTSEFLDKWISEPSETLVKIPTMNFQSHIIPKCITVENKQILSGMDVCLSGDNLEKSEKCIAQTTCDKTKDVYLQTKITN